MKKFIYIFAWIILGLLLSFIAHAVIELVYINYSFAHGIIPVNHTVFGFGYCVLPTYLQIILIVLGLFVGLSSGLFFWQVVYVDRKRPAEVSK